MRRTNATIIVMKITVVLPVYNEERVVANCLRSLGEQTVAKDLEIIVVDDGSTDKTLSKIGKNLVIRQDHKGPGAARNLGAGKARGDILVFVDADMEFEPDFLAKLTQPIVAGHTVGTFSKEEYLLNKNMPLARCWNLNFGRKADKMHSDNYPDSQNVFRAILREKFLSVGGFDTDVGYTDDWSLSRKLGEMAVAALGAKYYHRNPDNFPEIWVQARWFGKNEFLTGNSVRKFYNLLRYFPIFALFKGLFGALTLGEPAFLPFKVVFDSAVFTSVLLSFVGEPKSK